MTIKMTYFEHLAPFFQRFQPVLLVLLSSLALQSGCIDKKQTAGEIVFSPDGSTLAFVWNEAENHGPVEWLSPTYYTWGKKWEYLCVAPAKSGESCRVIEVNHVKKSPDFLAEFGVKALAISPNNKYIAYLLNGRIVVRQMQKLENHWLLSAEDETVESLQWLNDRELIYAATQNEKTKDKAKIHRKTIYRHRIHAPESRQPRTKLYEQICRIGEPSFEVSFSPDGQKALLIDPLELRLLNLNTGKISPPKPRRSSALRGLCWSPDGQRIFLAFGWKEGDMGPDGAILVDTQTGEVIDFSEQLEGVFGTNPYEIGSWTADGKYLIALDTRMLHMYLIKLKPWNVRRFEKRYDKKIPKADNDMKLIKGLKPGWLWVRPRPDGPTYATDYLGRRLIPIADYEWAMSHDYKCIAEIVTKGQFRIRPLRLPKLPPLPPKKDKHGRVIQPASETSDDKDKPAPAKPSDKPAEKAPKAAPQPITPPQKTKSPKQQPTKDTPPTVPAGPTQIAAEFHKSR